MRLLGVLGAVAALAAAPTPVAIRVSPAAVMAGGSILVTCRVTPDARNRVITATVTGYAQSSRDLAGADAAITWQFPPFTHIPCDVEAATCTLQRNDGASFIASHALTVAGCN